MAILFFWRGENYRSDTGARPVGPLTLHQNSKAFSALRGGERVWAFTKREDSTYVLAAQARVAQVTRDPGASKYGQFQMRAFPDSTVWYDVDSGADAELLIRDLGLSVGAGTLGMSFRGPAAVRQLTDEADARVEHFANALPVIASQARQPTRDLVLKAIAEYERLGQKAFLKKYGYWKAKEYVLLHKGKRYDSKAIYGVARGWKAQDFSGGDLTVRPWLEELGFKVERIPGAARPAALVLTAQDETSGGDYDFWEDETGVEYHFPNKYRNLVQTGLPFLYYRGVRRKAGKRGEPEYFGVGRIGEVRIDENHLATRASQRRWFCAVEDYREFPVPVPWKQHGATLERIKQNQFRDGVRHLPFETFERICKIAKVGVPTPPKQPDLPPIDEVTLTPATGGSLLIATARNKAPPEQSDAQRTKVPTRRSLYSKLYGDHAEKLVKRELEKRGKKGIRHLAGEGITCGFDLEYREGKRLVAVEVKGTTAKAFTSFDLTEGERAAAEKRGADFEIWLVANLRSRNPTFEVVADPFRRLSVEWSRTPLLWKIERSTKS